MKIVVLTARIGPADETLYYPVPQDGVRYVCVTDREASGWEVVAPEDAARPRWSARYAKAQVHAWFPKAEWTVWMDASLDLKVRPSVIVGSARATGCDVAGFRHSRRNRILDEARAILRWGFADQTRLNQQLRAYRAEGFDTDEQPQQVLTNGCLLVRRNTPQVERFSERWFAEIERHTLREQMSLDYAAWVTGTVIGHLRGYYHHNPYMRYKHDSHINGRINRP